MQIHLRIRYPRTLPEAKRIIAALDQAWLEVAIKARGLQRSKSFFQIIQVVNELLKLNQTKSKNDPDNQEFHQAVEKLVRDWSKKRKLPIK